MGTASSVDAAKKSARRRRSNCRKSTNWRCGRKKTLQQSCFALCNCRVCNRPFAVQKEIDYAIALLKHNGDSRAENHRESFETCPECKRQKCLVPSDRIELTRHMKEAI